MSAVSRLERLINLTGALVATERPLTAAELRERVPGYPDEKASFRRQFERDKEALRDLGLPIQLHELSGPDGEISPGYRIPRDEYAQRDPGLTDEERAALQVAARVVRLRGVDAPDAWWKLGVTASDASPSDDATLANSLVTFESLMVPAADEISGPVADIFEGIVARRELLFSYRDRDRRVVPGQLRYTNGHWYLAGFDATRGEERSFRIDRIEGAITLGEETMIDPKSVDQSEASALEPWELGSGPRRTALLLIDEAQAPWACRHLGDGRIAQRRPDGGVVFRLDVANVDAFRSFVLGFLDHAEVLEPPELRAAIRSWAASLAGPADAHANGPSA